MKLNHILLSGAIVALGLCACSLDRVPQDPKVSTEFNQDATFTKVYATFALTGQQGPAGDGDVAGVDEGTSAFYRMLWELNEFPTDEGYWIWNDVGLADIRDVSWNKSNTLVAGLYYRLVFNVTLCNTFLDKTKELDDAKTLEQRAEVRMVRAMNYYYLLDMFPRVPILESVASEAPVPATRAELFNWLERECKDLETLLPEAGKRKSLYRVDQASAWFVLMRMYLNAEVYTASKPGAKDGTAHWQEAANYAAKLMASPYKLLTESTGMYSAYRKLFMGNNDINGAQDEAVFMIAQDGKDIQSWGGIRFLVNAFRDGGMYPSGSDDSWSCFRTSPEFVTCFVSKNDQATLKEDEYTMPEKVGDDRALMCSYYQKPGADKALVWECKGDCKQDFFACWAVCKWTGIYANEGETPYQWVSPKGESSWPDTDIPLFRVAEAYLTYAEAVWRGANEVAGAGTKEDAIKVLFDRAHRTKAFNFGETALLNEWAREFYCEGHRRTDLVRFGQFAGDGVTKNWEARAGRKSGADPAKLDAKYNVYPIPENEETSNPNMRTINSEIGY